MRIAAVAMLGMMLAGCNGGGTPAGNDVAIAAAPDPTEAKLNAASDGDRRTAFFRAIYDADYECKKITAVQPLPRDQGRPAWRVTCDGNTDYAITLQAGGVFYVSGVPRGDGPRFASPRPTATAKP